MEGISYPAQFTQVADAVRMLSEEHQVLAKALTKLQDESEMVKDEIKINNVPADTNAALIPALLAGRGGDSMGLGGGGALGLVALLALLNRGGGVFGGSGDGGSAVNQLTLGQIQAALGDIKAAVPLAESQVQLALAGAQSDITQQSQAQTLSLAGAISSAKEAGVAAANQNALLLTNGFSNIGDKIDTMSTAQAVGFGVVNTGIERAVWQMTQAVSNDGEKTRALVTRQYEDTLNRELTDAKNEIIELRGERRRQDDAHGVAITMTNNQNQNQLQFQAQAQALQTVSAGLIDALQSIRATNQAINIGSGLMQANPTNTNTNVRT